MKQDYYDIPAISASGINDFIRSPLHFWNRTPLNPKRVKDDPTPAMVFGSLTHCLILAPDLFDNEFAIAPDVNRRTNEGKAELADFVQNHKGLKIITSEEYDAAIAMRDAMFANSDVKELLGNGCSEEPVTWRREPDGVLCKAKLDYLRSGLVLDYKTTEDARVSSFSRSVANFGYHRQMAWYMEAAQNHHNESPRGAVLIVQEKSLPQAIAVYALDADAIAYGIAECNRAYDEIRARLESKDWSAFPSGIQPLSLPRWYNA